MIFLIEYELDAEKKIDVQTFFANMTDEQIAGEYPPSVKPIGRWHDLPNGCGTVVVETDDQEALTSWMMGWASMATFPIVRPVVDDTMSRKAIKSMLASQQE